MTSVNSQNIILSIEKTLSEIDKFGEDQSGVELPVEITKTTISQSSDGSWSQSDALVENPYKSSTTIRDEISGGRNSTISNYEGIGIPFDNEIASLTQQINEKKSQIVSLVSSAVGAGCSVVYYSPKKGIGFAAFSETPPAIVVSGATIGYGATIFADSASVLFYDYQTNYSSKSPYASSSADISSVGSATSVFITTTYLIGNVSTGSTEITGINTGPVTLGLELVSIPSVISYGTTVVQVGLGTVFISNPGLSTVSAQSLSLGYYTISNTPSSGKGYDTSVKDNGGPSLGKYGTVDGYLLSTPPASGQPALPPVLSQTCVNIKNSIESVALEIINLRSRRDTLTSPVKEIKELKSGTELQKWSAERSNLVIGDMVTELNNATQILQNY